MNMNIYEYNVNCIIYDIISDLSVSPPPSPAVLQQPGHGPAELEAGLGLVSLGFAGVDTGPDVSW